jgi:plastocyanin
MRRLLLGTVLAVLACGGNDEGANASSADTGPRGSGKIVGTVNFTGAAPANPAIDMSEEPACRDKHQGGVRNVQYAVRDGKLGNVFVHVKSGLPQGARYAAPSEPVVLDQDGCLYEPRVFGVMVGQPIEIRNSDPLLHNIKAVPTENRGFNISQPTEGMKTTRTFNTAEVMVPLECNVHGWMNAYAGVKEHPFFATAGEDGTFTIENLPAGTYEVEAWHEKLGTRTVTVTVTDGGTATADFSFAPTTT